MPSASKLLLAAVLLAEPVASSAHRPAQEPLAFHDGQGAAWLEDVAVGVTLTGDVELSSRHSRFARTSRAIEGGTLTRFRDRGGDVDLELETRSLGDRSLRLVMRVHNRSGTDLRLDRLTVLEARRAHGGRPGRVLPNGMNSWANPWIAPLEPDGPARTSHWTVALEAPALTAGFLTGRHNVDGFTLNADARDVRLTAWAECEGCVLPDGATRESDPLFLSAEEPLLAELERFAELAAAENGARIWPRNSATWCSWYSGWIRQGMYEYKDGLQAGVEDNVPRVAALFGERGGAAMRIVDDSDDMPYGDWDDRTPAVPDGFAQLVRAMQDSAVTPGFWLPLYMVSDRTRLFGEHPEWLGRTAAGDVHLQEFYGNTCAVLDSSHPLAEQHLRDLGRDLRERGFQYVMTDFLVNAIRPARRHDPTATKAEMHRRGLEALREGFGPDVYWLGCGALLGSSMGLVDGMRISGDSFGDRPYSYLQTGLRWFYHRRLWLNDPDAIVCRGKSVAWNRGWMSWMALSGCVLTYGDTFDDLGEEHVALYRRILPPLDVAGRPLDLLENDPFLLWGVAVGEGEGHARLFGVFHFDEPAGLEVVLDLDEIAARIDSFGERPDDAPARWLLWDFWEQRLLESDGAALRVPLPDRTGRVLALHEARGRPQLLGTTGHWSMGALEVTDLAWDGASSTLSGTVRGNGGDPTALLFSLPEGFLVGEAALDGAPVLLHSPVSRVAALEVPGLPAPVPFRVAFRGTPAAVPRRDFEGGRAATIVVPGTRTTDPATLIRLRRLVARTPLGHRLAAWLDCGGTATVALEGGPTLHPVGGQPYTWEPALEVGPPSCASVLFDDEEVAFELGGLTPGRGYQLGFTWWDFDGNGRVQSVIAVNGEERRHLLLDRVRLPAWTGRQERDESLLLRLPPELVASGSLRIVFTREAPTHNAVVSEVWLFEELDR